MSLSESVLDRTDTKAHIAPEDLVLAAMHLLPSEEVEAARSHLKACLPCRQELARVCVDLAALAFTSKEEKPSLASRERLLAQVALEKKIVAPPVLAAPKPVVAAPAPAVAAPTPAVAAPTPAVAAPRPVGAAPKPSVVAPSASPEPALRPFADFGRGRGTTLLAEPDEIPSRRPALERWIGWATAAVFAVVSVILYTNHRTLNENLANQAAETQRLNARAAQSHQLLDALTDPQAIRAMLAPKASLRTAVQGPRGDITYNPEKGALIFLVGNLDPLQVYKTYQLWLLPAAGKAPIPAGTFHPDEHGNASVIMPKIPSGIDTKRFEVTIEDAGGTDKPSGPIVLTTS